MLSILISIIVLILLIALVYIALRLLRFIFHWLYDNYFAYDNIDIDNSNSRETKPLNPMNNSNSTNMIHRKFSPFAIRNIIVIVILLFSTIPLTFVADLVGERRGLYNSTLSDIAQKWGLQQSLAGPVLFVPIIQKVVEEKTFTDKDGKPSKITETTQVLDHVAILPEKLEINIQLNPQSRNYGIYRAEVYTANATISGEFVLPVIGGLADNITDIRWDKSVIEVALSDTRAIKQISALIINQEKSNFAPGMLVAIKGSSFNREGQVANGFHAIVKNINATTKKINFSLNLEFNGSKGIRFTPFGGETTTQIKSDWPHPSFQGDLLPIERVVSASGFSAKWQIPNLARNYPQVWINKAQSFNVYSLTTGVDLFEPVSLYSKITRAVKYGLLFIALTFMTFLIFELTQKASLHLMQYGLVAGAMILFYLTLLSLAEHISFLYAYLCASIIIILIITAYIWAALKSFTRALIIFAELIALYLLLYSLLQLEDYALLMGTGLLLVALMVLMYVTRNLQRE